MRVLFAGLIAWKTFPTEKQRLVDPDKPNGIAHFIDLKFLANSEIYYPLQWIAIACLILYAVGFLLWLTLPYLASFSIIVGTLGNSDGGIGHAYQMVSLILLGQAVVAVFCAICSRRFGLFSDEKVDTFLAYYAQVMIVSCYVTSAITKVKNSDGTWLWNSPYFSAEIVKTEYQTHYSRLDVPLDESSIQRAEWLVEHPMVARALFAPGLIFELLAFVALFSRRWAFLVGIGLIGMHWFIEFFMSLDFFLFEACVAIWLVNPAWWIVSGIRRVTGRQGS